LILMLFLWESIALGATPMSSAISLVVLPSFTSDATSISLGVKFNCRIVFRKGDIISLRLVTAISR